MYSWSENGQIADLIHSVYVWINNYGVAYLSRVENPFSENKMGLSPYLIVKRNVGKVTQGGTKPIQFYKNLPLSLPHYAITDHG